MYLPLLVYRNSHLMRVWQHRSMVEDRLRYGFTQQNTQGQFERQCNYTAGNRSGLGTNTQMLWKVALVFDGPWSEKLFGLLCLGVFLFVCLFSFEQVGRKRPILSMFFGYKLG